jgi:hypothetical protein
VPGAGVFKGTGVKLCRILDMNYRESPFHAVSILEDGCGRRFGVA